MLFVTASNNREKLEELSRLLLFAFPGSVIYQYTDPIKVPAIVSENRVSAVFAELKMEKLGGIELERLLHRKKPDLPIFILSDTEDKSGTPGESQMTIRLTRPISAEELRDLLKSKRRS